MSTDPKASTHTLGPDEVRNGFSKTERVVAALWSEVLQMPEQPDASANFFELGGDSIAMVTVEFRIKEELLVDLAPGTVLGAPTIRELSAAIDAAARTSSGSVAHAAD